ncbi:MAG TPA: hydrogenase formation protein HypD [Bacteroidota bacterium]|nr:hydrogenase formation protein HypD [Bacteroidota bacterium]
MKYLDEYRNGSAAEEIATLISSTARHPWTIMEICGGQTHSIVKSGLEALLPGSITLVHGPGCPVCVTPIEMVDKAVMLGGMKDVVLASFGDMLRVPGSHADLLSVRARGGDIRTVYSPLDAVEIAKQNPQKKVVFFAVGFETTAPAGATSITHAESLGLTNFFLLCSHVLVLPAMEAILSSPHNRVQGFLAAGHVCTVTGYENYFSVAEKYRTPIVVTGFEPVDILQGIYMTVKQLEEGRFGVENQYSRSVRPEGNEHATKLLDEVFDVIDRSWRGIGPIAMSGYRIKSRYARFDAEKHFRLGDIHAEESKTCMAGAILQGLTKPFECPAFGTQCTPERPFGAPMVSSEGACAAYYHYRAAS